MSSITLDFLSSYTHTQDIAINHHMQNRKDEHPFGQEILHLFAQELLF